MTTFTFRKPSALPGFGVTLGITLAYLSLVVLIPLAATFLKTATLTWDQFVAATTSPRVLASYRLTFSAALGGALVNAVFGFLVAWVLVRYTFPLKRLVDAIVDLPFALPTSVAGISLAAVYAQNGWIGRYLAPLGVKVAFTPFGVLVALTFIGLPFVVRTVQPVLEDFEREQEEAAACLGASRWLTFRRVVLPAVTPALLTGFALAFARAHLPQPVLIYASAAPDEVKQVQQALGIEAAGHLVEATLAAIARGLREMGVRKFVVAGGETSGAVVQALGVKALRIGAQIDPGVPATATTEGSPCGTTEGSPCGATEGSPRGTPDAQPLGLALKSGNFGSVDFFEKALRALEGAA